MSTFLPFSICATYCTLSSEAIEYGLCAVKQFAELDEDKMSDCYTAIDKAFYKGAADIYKDRVTDIKICARDYLSRR